MINFERMRIALISDIHFGEDTNYVNENFGRQGRADYVNVYGSQFPELYETFIKDTADVDLVVNLGDAIADKSEEEDKNLLDSCVSMLNRHSVEVIHVTGNHDRRYLPPSEIAGISNQSDTFFSFDKNGFHFVVLDAKWDDYPFRLLHGEMEWLKKDLQSSDLPNVVFVHYPVDETSHLNSYYQKGHPDGALLKEREELRELFESFNVRLACFGHTHFFNHSKINGVEYINCPSFTENDGQGKPSGKYLVVTLNDTQIEVDEKSV